MTDLQLSLQMCSQFCMAPIYLLSQVNDSIQLDLATNKVQDIITFEVGNLCMVTGGANAGRVGTMISR